MPSDADASERLVGEIGEGRGRKVEIGDGTGLAPISDGDSGTLALVWEARW